MRAFDIWKGSTFLLVLQVCIGAAAYLFSNSITIACNVAAAVAFGIFADRVFDVSASPDWMEVISSEVEVLVRQPFTGILIFPMYGLLLEGYYGQAVIPGVILLILYAFCIHKDDVHEPGWLKTLAEFQPFGIGPIFGGLALLVRHLLRKYPAQQTF